MRGIGKLIISDLIIIVISEVLYLKQSLDHSVIYSFNHSFVQSFIHSFIHFPHLLAGQLITMVRMKKYFLHPGDLHLIFNLVHSSESFKVGLVESMPCLFVVIEICYVVVVFFFLLFL